MDYTPKLPCSTLFTLLFIVLIVQSASALDSTKPQISQLRANSITSTSAVILWTTNEPATTQVRYGTTTAYGKQTALDGTLTLAHSVLVSGLTANTVYNYRALTADIAGNLQTSSNHTFKTLAANLPTAPSNASAAANSSNRIDVSWTDNSTNETGFYVFQSTDGVNFAKVGTLGANVKTYAAQNLQSNREYSFRVRAYNGSGSSSNSNTATAKTQGGAPIAPTNLSASSASSSQINLSWTDNSSDESGFYVYRSTDASNFTYIGTIAANVTQYSAENLTPQTTYYFFVCSFNSFDHSYDSNIAQATTEDPAGPVKIFPGAVGFGIETPGGRGGAVLKVTNLNNAGAGSLRAAVEAAGRRTVIFEISGTITLSSELKITQPYLTIAGQTAPSPGITLRAGELNIKTHDVLVQHLRIRLGDQLPSGTDPEGADTLSVEGPAYNVVMDHISVSWGIDENGTSWYDDLHDVTFSNCIISEALQNSIHPKGAHSMGLLATPNGRNLAMIGNVVAHNSDRNPLISNGSSTFVANNVFYNWVGGRATNIGNYSSSFPQKFPTEVSVIGNVYIAGFNTPSGTNAISTSTSLSADARIYIADNRLVGLSNAFRNVVTYDPIVTTPPVTVSGFNPISSTVVENSVTANAGARPADRDEVDHRIINEVKTRTGRLINSQSEVGGWPTLAVNRRTINVPANANADDDGDGYTNFEEQVLFPMANTVEGK